MLRAAADGRFRRLGGGAREQPRIPGALGADLAGGRPDTRGVSPRLRRYAEDQRTDRPIPFFLFRNADKALVGGLTITNIRRGVAQAGSLGYWIGAAYARRGYMTAAVRVLVPFAFRPLKLHRIEAACIPTNAASVRLLEKTGFRREGYAREYLCINGIWQDHLLYARLPRDPRG